MNLIKSASAAAAGVLFATTLASAQTVEVDATNGITFSVTITQLANITVIDNALSDADLTMASNGTVAASDLALAGTIEVETNLAAWNVFLTAENGGKLLNNSAEALKTTVGSVGNSFPDVVLRVNACFEPTEASIATCTVNNIDASTSVVIGATPITAPISLADALGKTGGYRPSDTDANNKANFAIYAVIPATIEELIGNGEYTESISVSLQSTY